MQTVVSAEVEPIDGHVASVVERVDEGEVSYLVVIDEATLNGDGPLGTLPTDEQVRDMVRRWAAGPH